MSDIKIEKGVSLPSSCGKNTFPWDKMQAGDSFFVDDMTARNAALSSARYRKINAKTRAEGSGYRVWRIS